jgi:ankyrin repeat protein
MNRSHRWLIPCVAMAAACAILVQPTLGQGLGDRPKPMPEVGHHRDSDARLSAKATADEELLVACMYYDLVQANRALSRRASLDARTQNGATPLIMAAESGFTDMVELLVKKGADLNARTPKGWTALHSTALWGQKQAAERLLGHGAQPDNPDDQGWTPLMWAAAWGRLEICDALLNKQADIEARSSFGQTPLIIAAFYGLPGVVDLFLKKGADVKVQDQDGKTALDYAKARGHEEVAKLLETPPAASPGKSGSGLRLMPK